MKGHDFAVELGDVIDGLSAGVTLVGLALITPPCEMELRKNRALSAIPCCIRCTWQWVTSVCEPWCHAGQTPLEALVEATR